MEVDYITEELSRYSLAVTPPEDESPNQVPGYETAVHKPKSLSVVEKSLKVTRYMNTYRLEPKRPFSPESVHMVLQEVLTRDLAEVHYEPTNMTRVCVSLAGEIRSRVKQLNFDRYKIVCLVQIVEKHQQSILSTAKFLWDTDRDHYATFSLNNAHIAAMACVFGIYYE